MYHMSLIINTSPIYLSADQLTERATVIVVVERAEPKERLMIPSDTAKKKEYVERYIVHECLRGTQSSGELIEVIHPNSSERILMEEGTHVTMLKRSFVYKEEEHNVIASSKKEILFLIETHHPDIYNYAFDGLKLNVRYLDTIQTSIQSQPQPFQKKYIF